ncbi:MAG: hypothetical protein ACUVS4_15460, partial [Chloroflexaceae bacterium]
MEHLPPWLRNLPLPPRPTGYDEPAPSASVEAEAEVPEWLRDLRREVSDDARSGAAEVPEWLRDIDQPAPAPPAEPAPRTPLRGATSWLSDLGRNEPGAPAEPAPAVDQPTTSSRIKMPSGATDWLRSIGPDPDAPSEPLSEPISEPLDPDGVPDWLRDLNPDEVARAVEGESPAPSEREWSGNLAAETPPADASTLPAQRTPSAPISQPSESLLEEPDWLREFIAPQDQKVSPELEVHSDRAEDIEVPTWLREITEASQGSPEGQIQGAPYAEGTEDPGRLREAAEAPPPAPEREVPAWLRDAA